MKKLMIIMLCFGIIFQGCGKLNINENDNKNANQAETDLRIETEQDTIEDADEETEEEEQEEFGEQGGYNLPVSAEQHQKMEQLCISLTQLLAPQYQTMNKDTVSDQGETQISGKTLTEEELLEYCNTLSGAGYVVMATYIRENMRNPEKMEQFIIDLDEKEDCEIVVLKVREDGSIGIRDFYMENQEFYMLEGATFWNSEFEIKTLNVSLNQVKDWTYTEKGWFSYQLYVPEYPVVTEVMSDTDMFRVKALPQECLDFENTYLIPISYADNNLLRISWDANTMDQLDFNALYDAFYRLNYQERFLPSEEEIAPSDFENLMGKYLKVNATFLQNHAKRNKDNSDYLWTQYYTPEIPFGTSVPEVTKISENADGTLTIYVDAVCEMMGNDRVFSHELKVKIDKKGGITFIGNKINQEYENSVPKYYFRLS